VLGFYPKRARLIVRTDWAWWTAGVTYNHTTRPQDHVIYGKSSASIVYIDCNDGLRQQRVDSGLNLEMVDISQLCET
jgi:hypothetical protein